MEHGIDCVGKTTQSLTRSDYDKYDLLVRTNQANIPPIRRICGGDLGGKTRLLMEYTDHPGDVADL